MSLAKRVTGAFVFSAIVLLAAPAMVSAQASCIVDDLPREANSQGRLAVNIDGSWRFFAQGKDEPAHVLEAGELQTLCIAWEAPPYHGHRPQIVYVSTRHMDEQPLWLFRNNTVPISLFGRRLGNWNRTPDASGLDPDDAFRKFHRSRPEDLSDAPWNYLVGWHDTSAWLPNVGSYELVVGAINGLSVLPYGAERLLRLRADRPFTSWVPFTTRAPSEQNELRVAVAYSGDLETIGPYVYQYVFQVK